MPSTLNKEAERGWMNAEEVAEYLGVAAGTIRQWVKLKKIPHGKAGSLARFDRAEIDAWVRSRGVPADASDAAA